MAGVQPYFPRENDIFRFVSVRGVNLPEAGASERRFAFSGLPNDYAGFDAHYPGSPLPRPMLLVELPKLKNEESRAALMARAAVGFVDQSPYRIDEATLEAKYPAAQLRLVELWHRDGNRDRSMTPAVFIARVEAALGASVSAFIGGNDYPERKVRVWENLIAQYILSPTGNGAFVARLTDMARWFWIIEKAAGQRFQDGQEIYEAMHATVVLPDNVVYVDQVREEADEPETREPEVDEQQEKDKTRLRDLEEAKRTLTLALRNRAADERHAAREREAKDNGPTSREKPAALGASDMLDERGLAALDPTTRSVLRELDLVGPGGVNLSRAVERIDNAHEELRGRTPEKIRYVPTVDVNGRLTRLDNMCHHYTPPDPCKPYRGEPRPKGVGLIRPPGMADLKVIRSVLLKYERGELAHVENVLKGETKVREFNTMKRTEETLVTEEETTSETEQETQTTDRFEMEKEISSITKEDMKLDTGVKVTATLGPVKIDTHFDFQYNTSKEESNRVATENSKETINRAASRVTERRRKQRTVTNIVQTDDRNKHKLVNVPGANNIHGLYYWLDKYYLSKVVNYGKRLMFEFVVPEPAAFFLFASQQKAEGEKVPPVPLYLLGIYSLEQITDTNWPYLAAFYGAQDITPPPPAYVVVSTSLEHDKTPIGEDQEDVDKEDIEFTLIDTNEKLKVPAGYLAHHADISFVIEESTSKKKVGRQCDNGVWGTGLFQNCEDVFEDVQSFHILIGNRHLRPHADWSPMTNILLNTEDAVVPVAVNGKGRHFVATFEVVCYRTEKKYKEWKGATFNALVTAFNNKVDEYEDWQRTREIGSGVAIEGNNPEINRKVEREELKKHCIEMMTGQRFETFDAMRSNVPSLGYPEFSFLEAHDEGQYLQFFEQAFEWEQMTYVFYPYFWGRKPQWVAIKKLTDPDPIFTSFLQAGAARVLVPARPGFEEDVVTFFASGGLKIWGGKQAPIPGEEKWLPIIDELKEQQGQFTGGAQEGDPWIYKLPTTLVFLDDINAPLLDNSPKYPIDVAAAMTPKPGDFA